MFSRIQGFISRHRRKFFGVAVAGAVIWGGWSYVSWKMQRTEEEYVREVLKKAKRHMHHKSSAQAAEKQVMALVPVAAKATNDALDTSCIVNQLKSGTKASSKDERKGDKETPAVLTPEDRLAKWDELKRVSVARAVAYAYIPSILIVFIRLQLGILGGYVFKSCGGDNIAAFLDGSEEKKSREENQESLPLEIQETYLSLTQFFLEGQSGSIAQKQVISFQESSDDFLDLNESYWSNHSSSNGEGKSRLNLGQRITDGKALNTSYHSVSSSPKKQNELVIPSKITNDVQCLKGNDIPDESDVNCKVLATDFQSPGNSKNVEDSNVPGIPEVRDSDKRLKENSHGKLSVRCVGDEKNINDSPTVILNDDPSLCSMTKSLPMSNGIPSCYESLNGDPILHETSAASINTEEADDSKDISNGEIAEEDSGRCSGTDDISEDEVHVARSKSGIEVLCSLLENKVGTVVDNLSLKTPLSLAETETLFWGVLTAIRSNPAEDPAFNLPKYLLPPPLKMQEAVQDIESRLGNKAATLFNDMISETSDLLETKEVVELVQSCVSAGLGHIMDRLANHFPEESLGFDTNLKSASCLVPKEGQLKPVIPLAKLIPIISKVAFEEGTPWVKLLLEMGNLKDFGANVYEAFTH